jgi:hypothetical protein
MLLNAPLINFNGAFLVQSLVVGSLQIHARRTMAVRVLIQQTLQYPVLAYENHAAQIYAYCLESRRQGKKRLEAYAPCYLVRDHQSGELVPVIASITWYLSGEFRNGCADVVNAILGGDVPGDEVYPPFEGEPFAVFKAA